MADEETVFVDSGLIWVGDPGYLATWLEDNGWEGFGENLFSERHAEARKSGVVQPIGLNRGLAIMCHDAPYDVTVVRDASGEVRSVTIDLDPFDDEDVPST